MDNAVEGQEAELGNMRARYIVARDERNDLVILSAHLQQQIAELQQQLAEATNQKEEEPSDD